MGLDNKFGSWKDIAKNFFSPKDIAKWTIYSLATYKATEIAQDAGNMLNEKFGTNFLDEAFIFGGLFVGVAGYVGYKMYKEFKEQKGKKKL